MEGIPAQPGPTTPAHDALINSRSFGRGLAVIRIFFGLIIFANGLAKLNASWAQIDLGAYHANLITRQGARNILNFEVNQRQTSKTGAGTQLPYLKHVVNSVVLGHASP